jgi:hypothetical protein
VIYHTLHYYTSASYQQPPTLFKMSTFNSLLIDAAPTAEASPLIKKRKESSSQQYTDGEVPNIMEFLENSLDKEDKKMFKRVKHYVKSLENKNAVLEAQQKSLLGEILLPPSAKPLLDKYAGSFTSRNQGQDSLEYILKLIVKDSTVRYDHKEKETKLSKVAFYERKENFLERGFNKVDKVLEAVQKVKKAKAIATVKGHKKRDVDATTMDAPPVDTSTMV